MVSAAAFLTVPSFSKKAALETAPGGGFAASARAGRRPDYHRDTKVVEKGSGDGIFIKPPHRPVPEGVELSASAARPARCGI